jgi:NitT/TauT family transport system substrate-binding protein
MRKRTFLQAATAAALSWALPRRRHAAKFQLDWRFEGPAALFVHPEQKGYFKQAGLDVNGGRQRRRCHPARGLGHP